MVETPLRGSESQNLIYDITAAKSRKCVEAGVS